MSTFRELFPEPPLIACVHLLPLPGAPRYGGDPAAVYETAVEEAALFERHGVDGLIVENFRDVPFYPDRLPPETVAAMAVATARIVERAAVPVGVNALRNDPLAALAIAAGAGAAFIRVNVHMGAAVSDQGILQGEAHRTLRRREELGTKTLIFADADVKHASPLGSRDLADEVTDLSERGLADAVIVSGTGTGAEASVSDLETARGATSLPVLVGSGATADNLDRMLAWADGCIVGSALKVGGRADNPGEESRVVEFVQRYQAARSDASASTT